MKFTKMEGLGNDYVYVNCLAETVENPKELAIRVSDRHFGIGSDGLILIKPSKVADFTMDMYNADGSQSEMCGNGIRCVGKYVYDYGLTDKTDVAIETLAGIKYLKLTVDKNQTNNVKSSLTDGTTRGKVSMVTVNMGEPIFEPEKVPVKVEKRLDKVLDYPVVIGEKEWNITCVSMGNPHCITFVDDVNTFPLEKYGPIFESHEMFPNRVNAEFLQIVDRTSAKMRVWERGSGETLACGTGTCASVVAAILNGLTDDCVTVELLGGKLTIEWNRETNIVYMTGPATTVFDGEIVV